MIKRELYLKKLRDSYDSELIKVITGIRRCGKSILLLQIIEELKEKGIKEENIIYINFEDYDYEEYTDPKKLNNYVKEKIIDDKKYYIFFDEIQACERALTSLKYFIINLTVFYSNHS